MDADELKKLLADHKKWLESDGKEGKCADLQGADLQGADLQEANLLRADLRGANLQDANLQDANLQGADLRGANLQDANLQDANLQGANLQGADLRGADLQFAYLRGADLQGANLRGADLQFAYLRGADLRRANLDYSCWPLWCGSLSPKIDKRQAAQLLYHALRAMQSCADEPDVAAVLGSEACLRLANQFHRVDECGRIEPPGAGGEGGAE